METGRNTVSEIDPTDANWEHTMALVRVERPRWRSPTGPQSRSNPRPRFGEVFAAEFGSGVEESWPRVMVGGAGKARRTVRMRAPCSPASADSVDPAVRVSVSALSSAASRRSVRVVD